MKPVKMRCDVRPETYRFGMGKWKNPVAEGGIRSGSGVLFPDILIVSMVGCGVDSLDRTESGKKIGPRGI
jgi:hypothetical protein